MPQISDDLRFQELPPEEIRTQLRKSIDKFGCKYILIEHTTWYNQKTRCKHDIYNMPILAFHDNSERPMAITTVTVQERPTGGWTDTKTYIYNQDYVHVNICVNTSSEAGSVNIPDADDENKRYCLRYEKICNPITMHHFYSTDNLENLKIIFTGQLMGQNSNSPFRTVSSVAGTYHDAMIKTTTGSFIKRNAPIIQLLTRLNLSDIASCHNNPSILNKIRTASYPKGNEIACKLIQNEYYMICSKEELEKYKEKKKISAYYPVITAEMCKDLLANLPKINIDFGCFGLGSAGTGVLDLLSRSTFFEEYLFADFDTIEAKNLRNQWYLRNQTGGYKAQYSKDIFLSHKNNCEIPHILYYNKKFQELTLESYTFKYVFSAFDSIETRLDLLNTLAELKTPVRYWIDARYDDLTASVFVIDMHNKEQLDYYVQGLKADQEAFNKQTKDLSIDSEEKFIEYLEQERTFTNRCSTMLRKLAEYHYNHPTIAQAHINDVLKCPRSINENCRNKRCLDMFKKFYNEHKELCKKKLKLNKELTSCVRQNFMDIYHFASTFIFDAIREIENGKEKPFTHVDVTTDPLPKYLILRK